MLATYEIVCSSTGEVQHRFSAFTQSTIGAEPDGLEENGYIRSRARFQQKLTTASQRDLLIA